MVGPFSFCLRSSASGVLQAVVMEDMCSRTCSYVDTLALCTTKIAVYSHQSPSDFSRDRSAGCRAPRAMALMDRRAFLA